MLFVLAIIGLTLGATAIQLAPEVAGEAIAMYIVEPPGDGGYGASFDPNNASEIPAITPAGESSVCGPGLQQFWTGNGCSNYGFGYCFSPGTRNS